MIVLSEMRKEPCKKVMNSHEQGYGNTCQDQLDRRPILLYIEWDYKNFKDELSSNSQIAALDFTPMRYVKTGELNRRIIEQWNN